MREAKKSLAFRQRARSLPVSKTKEARPRATLVVAILRRIASTLLMLFRTVTQRSDERRAIPWDTLMTDFFATLITTTMLELQEPRPLRRR